VGRYPNTLNSLREATQDHQTNEWTDATSPKQRGTRLLKKQDIFIFSSASQEKEGMASHMYKAAKGQMPPYESGEADID